MADNASECQPAEAGVSLASIDVSTRATTVDTGS